MDNSKRIKDLTQACALLLFLCFILLILFSVNVDKITALNKQLEGYEELSIKSLAKDLEILSLKQRLAQKVPPRCFLNMRAVPK